MTTWGPCVKDPPENWGACDDADTTYDPLLPCEIPPGGVEAVEVTSLQYPLLVEEGLRPNLVLDEIILLPVLFREYLRPTQVLDEVEIVQVLFDRYYETEEYLQSNMVFDEVDIIQVFWPRYYELEEYLQPDLLLTDVDIVQVLFPIYYDRGTHDLAPTLTLDSVTSVPP